MTKTKSTFLALLAVLLSPMAANAVPIAGVEWTSNGLLNDGPWNLGYLFEVSEAIRVTDLGAFDDGGDGFQIGHELGLWTAGGTLLASGSLASGASGVLDGHFRYDDIVDVILGPGTYVVSASHFGAGNELFAWNPVGFSSGPAITYLADRWVAGAAFQFAGNSNGGFGWWGGNFRYEVVSEPGTLALLSLGLLGLGLSRRKKV